MRRRRRQLPLADLSALAAEVTIGLAAALRTPSALRGPQFRTLLVSSSIVNGDRPCSADPAATLRARAGRAIRAANATLLVLSKLPIARHNWRNTCLFRGIAACMVFRRYGIPARLRLGARTEDRDSARVRAHAWVELDAHHWTGHRGPHLAPSGSRFGHLHARDAAALGGGIEAGFTPLERPDDGSP